DVDSRIYAMQEANHAHVRFVIGHGDGAVFRHYEIDAHNARIGSSDFKTEQRLGKDLLLWKSAKHLIHIADLNFAGGLVCLTATFTRAAQIFSVIENGASDGNVVAQSRRKQIAAKPGQVLPPTDLFGYRSRVSEIERRHDFEILFILRGGTSRNLVEPFAYVRRVCAYELRKRVEEMVVTGAARRRHETPHGKSVNDRVVQVLVAKSLCDRDLTIGANGIGRIALR